jgi:hypothetical protein
MDKICEYAGSIASHLVTQYRLPLLPMLHSCHSRTLFIHHPSNLNPLMTITKFFQEVK